MKEGETLSMFLPVLCKAPGCHIYSVKGSDYCFHHSSNRAGILSDIMADLESGKDTSDISIVGAELTGLDIRNKTIAGCNFAFCVFDRCHFENVSITASFFDFALFRNTEIIDSEIRYSVFSGSLFMNSEITESTAIHNNFIGIDSYDSDFSHNDFYYSNFSVSKFLYSKMEDCNLKRADFSNCLMKEISFRYSNINDAYRCTEDSAT